MSATEPRLRATSRWSQACKCPRMGAYGLLGTEPDEPSEQLQRYRRRGKDQGRYVADVFIAKYGADDIVLEKDVAWPGGELHPDIYIRSERMPVEVKSSDSPQSVFDDALVQLAGEIHYDPDADTRGILAIVHPSTYVIDIYPFQLTDEWVERVEKIAHDVVRAGATRGKLLPERVCEAPRDGRNRFCPFVDHCFADWTEPEPATLDNPELRLLAVELYRERLASRGDKQTLELRQSKIKQLEQRIADLAVIEPGHNYTVGPIEIRMIATGGGESFSITRARKAGIWSPLDDERFGSYVTQKESGYWIRTDRVSDDPLLDEATAAVAFGADDEAPF